MNHKRTIQKLSSIIDLFNHDSARLIGKPYIRIRYEYDGLEDRQDFTVLNVDIPRESADRIISWLRDNITLEDIIYGKKPSELDVQSFDHQERMRSINP